MFTPKQSEPLIPSEFWRKAYNNLIQENPTMTPTEVPTTADYDMSIHSNPDHYAWAKFFMESLRKSATGLDEEMMAGWFANAMMAKADSMQPKPEPPRPSKLAVEKAASLWTYPQHSSKEIDIEFATSIAYALDSFKEEAAKDAQRYRVEIESPLKRIDQKLTHQDQLIRDQRGRLEVFETMKALFENGRRDVDGMVMGDSLSWLIRQTIEYGSPYPAAASEGLNARSR